MSLKMNERVGKMPSVTSRIRDVRQPHGGFVKLSEFDKIAFDDGKDLHQQENIAPSVIGMVVDYLTRFMLGERKEDVFRVSLNGAKRAELFGEMKNAFQVAVELCEKIEGTDKKSIINACKLATFDVWYRNIIGASKARTYNDTEPDDDTIDNISILVSRGIELFRKYGPIKVSGFTFEPADANENISFTENSLLPDVGGGYTNTVRSGDGDFLTEDTMWDFKVSVSRPDSKNILQLLTYWIMGQHSGQEIFKSITKIGIFNPRMNEVFLLDMSKVPNETIRIIENEVICYGKKTTKIKRDKSWVYYMTEEEYKTQKLIGDCKSMFSGLHSGKWIIPCRSYEEASKMCRLAVEECNVAEARHSADFSRGEGVCYFYIPDDEIKQTKQFISYFKKHGLLPKSKKGIFENIEFKSDLATELGFYDGVFTGGTYLCDYINLVNGEWTDKSYILEKEEEKKKSIRKMAQEYGDVWYSSPDGQLRKEDCINSEYVKDEIEKQGKTIKEIAEYLDVKEATVRAWINGKTRPLIGNAMGLCLFLGLEPSKVITTRE